MLLYKNSDKTATIRKQKQRKNLLNSNIHRILMNECINIKELSNEKDYVKLITCIVLHSYQRTR